MYPSPSSSAPPRIRAGERVDHPVPSDGRWLKPDPCPAIATPDPLEGVPLEALQKAVSEWVAANKVRLVIVLITWFVLLKPYTVVAVARHRGSGQ